MPRQFYQLAPLQNAMMTDYPSLQIPDTFSPWVQNIRVDQHSANKRWGYYLDRSFESDARVLNIAIYQLMAGTRYCMILTDTNAAVRKTGASETFQYITDTYTTGTIASLNVAKTEVTGNAGTNWATSGVAAGDYFIINADESANIEHDANWAKVTSVGNDTTLNLTSAYTGAATSGAYKIRKVYSTPANERWSYATVGDKFCFTNGNTPVQYWAGSGYATALDSTNALNARYCIEFANRLFLADVVNPATSLRDPLMIQWSAEGDPTDWTDPVTSGSAAMLDTEDYITGLGKVGPYLVIYKRNTLYFFGETGVPTSPISSSPNLIKTGIGNIAPYSIVEALGTNIFLGQDDFYKIEGTDIQEISHEKIRHKFFELVSTTEREHVWGFANYDEHEITWVANTTSGQVGFTWDYKHDQWYPYSFADNISGAGRGAI